MAVLIDLSHPLEDGQPNFPLDPQIRVAVHNTVAAIGTTSPRSACRPIRGRIWTCRFISLTTARPWIRCR